MPDVAGLFDSFLETAASLAVLFIVVAWVSSKIVELIQLGFNFHGRVLRSELERCFGEDEGKTKGRFTRYFYWHPMIVPLTQPSLPLTLWRRARVNAASDWNRLRAFLAPLLSARLRGDSDATASSSASTDPCYPPGRLPAHIAPETFAAVVMNPFPWPTTEEPLRRLLEANLKPEVDSGGNPIASEPNDDRIRELANLLVLNVRSVHPGETWDELLARPEVKEQADTLGRLKFKRPFREASVDPASAVADEAELLLHFLRSNAKDEVADDRLREITGQIMKERPVPPESWDDLFRRLQIKGADFFPEHFLRRGARIPASDAADRYFQACSCNDLVPHELETRIVTLLRDADGDLEEFRAGLKRWYAEAMERVTGRFKRTALLMLFIVALIICAAFNLNALTIIDGLIGNPELRGLGMQASRAIGDNPRGMAALSQKLQFQYVGAKCTPEKPGPDTPDCDPYEMLKALWVDHSQPVVFADAKVFPATTPSDGDVADRKKAQVVAVREWCNANGLCSPTLTATLGRCETSANAGATGAPVQPAATGTAAAPAPPTTTTTTPADDKGTNDPDEACSRAWAAVWRNPDFFWHPEAAHKFASQLWGGEKIEPADQRALVKNLREQAEADTEAVKKYITMLPKVGWIEPKERAKELGEEPFWVFFGIFLSAALAALGAPFWYDVLGKISGRGGGRTRGEKA
jgi:hypothetical protein